MSKPPRDLKVTEQGDYVEDGLGPAEDTDVFSKGEHEPQPERPAHLDEVSRNRPEEHPGDPMHHLRHHGSGHDRQRKRVPGWVGLAVGLVTAAVVAFSLVVLAGVLLSGFGEDGASAVSAPAAPAQVEVEVEEPPQEIQGVRIRKGLKRGPEEEQLPPKRKEP